VEEDRTTEKMFFELEIQKPNLTEGNKENEVAGALIVVRIWHLDLTFTGHSRVARSINVTASAFVSFVLFCKTEWDWD
jgi:hypothetical protein